MKVTLVDFMGTDLTVVNAARVSFAKKSSGDLDIVSLTRKPSEADKKLITYLAKHGHWSPFSHPQVQLHVKAPIFVARQLGKHQVGLAWNEISRRYVDYEPEFYAPENWRKKSPDKKQGSLDESVDTIYDSYGHTVGIEEDDYDGPVKKHLKSEVDFIADQCKQLYNEMIKAEVCPEQARMVLPQSMYTEWYWTGSLYAWARVNYWRNKPDTQKETQEIAIQIHDIMKDLFPESWKALTNQE